MNYIKIILSVLLVLLSLSLDAHKMTEQYIPIGQSPGVSNKLTLIGTIESVSPYSREISITVSDRTTKTYVISEKTYIWLDASKLKQTNSVAKYEDLKTGQRVELKPAVEQGNQAAWIKIEKNNGN